jgi:hypothetical protein
MKLVIDRSKWLRGEGAEDSYLFRPSDGKMCCLGFYGSACKLNTEQMAARGTPYNVSEPDKTWTASAHWLFNSAFSDASSTCFRLMEANDNEELPAEEREEDIIRLFAEHGVEVEFVG